MKKDTKFKKGSSGNPGGRPKGVPNKSTAELKEAIKTIIDTELEQLQAHLDSLEPKERLDFIARILPYVIPKQSEVKTEQAETIHISFVD